MQDAKIRGSPGAVPTFAFELPLSVHGLFTIRPSTGCLPKSTVENPSCPPYEKVTVNPKKYNYMSLFELNAQRIIDQVVGGQSGFIFP